MTNAVGPHTVVCGGWGPKPQLRFGPWVGCEETVLTATTRDEIPAKLEAEIRSNELPVGSECLVGGVATATLETPICAGIASRNEFSDSVRPAQLTRCPGSELYWSVSATGASNQPEALNA